MVNEITGVSDIFSLMFSFNRNEGVGLSALSPRKSEGQKNALLTKSECRKFRAIAIILGNHILMMRQLLIDRS